MKAFLFVALIVSFSLNTIAQKQMIIWKEKQPLQWSDFAGSANDTSSFDAESFAEVVYNYHFTTPADFRFQVNAVFNKNISWYKKEFQTADLLLHEQLHFDIAALYAIKLKDALENYKYSEDYKNEILKLFNDIKCEYHFTQKQYDENTNHSLQKNNQKNWEQYISRQLFERINKINLAKN